MVNLFGEADAGVNGDIDDAGGACVLDSLAKESANFRDYVGVSSLPDSGCSGKSLQIPAAVGEVILIKGGKGGEIMFPPRK